MLQTTPKTIGPAGLDQLNKLGLRLNRAGANFAIFDLHGNLLLKCDCGQFDTDYTTMGSFAAQSGFGVSDSVYFEAGRVMAMPIELMPGNIFLAAVDFGPAASPVSSAIARELIHSWVERLQCDLKSSQQIEIVSGELAHTYEELVLLYKMSTNMKVTESDSNYLQMACDSLTDLVSVEGIAIMIERLVNGERRLVLTAGSGLIDIDQNLAYLLLDRLAEQVAIGKDALLDSDVDRPLQYAWPERIKNVIAVPLYGNSKMIGFMVAINRLDKPDFDSTDVKLFNSVANECAVFIENGRLFTDLKELLVGSLKALTNSIDAKDQYTLGHSERVAFISRWIAEKLAQQEPVEEEFIHQIYLAGLLHDIGKIGINEAVLRKNGALTEDERNQIKAHPTIGSGILSEIKQMNEIIPGVLCHHERIDGKGYPAGLSGEQIPLLGRIIGIADSFDAMTSKRVYRNAMDINKALEEVQKGLGTQFDDRIGRIFIKDGGYELWKILQDGMTDSSYRHSFAQYGNLAVGSLLR
jgi:HD-GYP domain-containing protein (c-di-GMP phosphodiesterase class II)